MIRGSWNKARALRDARDHAEGRYFAYEREVKEALDRAYDMSRKGDYAGASNVLMAGMSSMAAMAGTARELNLYYTLTEEGN